LHEAARGAANIQTAVTATCTPGMTVHLH